MATAKLYDSEASGLLPIFVSAQVAGKNVNYCVRQVKSFLSENLNDGLSMKNRVDYQQKHPKRFFGVVKPPESHPVPFSEPILCSPIPSSERKSSSNQLQVITTSWLTSYHH